MAKFILETNYRARQIIHLSINPKTNFDEYFVYIHVTCCICYTTGVLVLSRGSLVRDQKQCGGTCKLFDFHLSCLKFHLQCFLNFFKYLYIWGLLQCQTFQYCSPPNGVITSAVLWIKYNFHVRVSVCPSQLCFPFFFEEAVVLLDSILKKASQETLRK